MKIAALPGSLRGRLFAFMLALAGVTALAVGCATYVSVRAEADALFDYHLRQMALSLRDQGRIGEEEREALANPEFDYLLFVGCAAAYDDRIKKTMRALVEVGHCSPGCAPDKGIVVRANTQSIVELREGRYHVSLVIVDTSEPIALSIAPEEPPVSPP